MTKRSSLVGFTNLKNKVHKNAFDLSHRHMYSAEIGELLPVFYQWCNPNETFKIGYQGMTRTLPLQTAAFTRLRENIQYYFVPFQSLWKYFEQTVTNMTVGQSGESISRIAQSALDPAAISTRMPYINYNSFNMWFAHHLKDLVDRLVKDVADDTALNLLSGVPSLDYLMSRVRSYRRNDGSFIFLSSYDTFRYVGAAKLLNALGYGNFSNVFTFDVLNSLIQWFTYLESKGVQLAKLKSVDVGEPTWSTGYFENTDNFFGSKYSISFTDFEQTEGISNSPNLSVFPLLAYQKIVQDHYRYRQWQPYLSQLCNIDYIAPPSNNYDFFSFYGDDYETLTIFDMQFGNLPLDYFNGVLPRAQYGDESSALVNTAINTTNKQVLSDLASHDVSALNVGEKFTMSAFYPGIDDNAPVSKHIQTTSVDNTLTVDATGGSETDPAYFSVSGGSLANASHIDSKVFTDISMPSSADSSLRISALRSALALQKYKEIQNSNDSDFASQVLAHFGIKPRHDDYTSNFIGGGDATIDINPQVNQNLESAESKADIKAIATSTLSAGCKFTADTFGIIIGVYRCTPQLDFAHVGIDRNLYKTDASDFPIPELDSIGMQTQYRSEVAALPIGSSKPFVLINDKNKVDFSETYGYLPRYAELKTSYDRYDGAFLDSQSTWVTGYSPNMISSWIGKWDGYTSSTDYRLNVSDLLKVRPSLCYPVFFDQFSGSVNDDKLLVGSVNTCVAVRPFTKFGLPYES